MQEESLYKTDLKGDKESATDNIVLVWGHLQADMLVRHPDRKKDCLGGDWEFNLLLNILFLLCQGGTKSLKPITVAAEGNDCIWQRISLHER